MTPRFNILFLLILTGLLISSCGVDKKGKLKPVSRFNKDLTSRYNGYFNSEVLLDEYMLQSREDLESEVYDHILPVYGHLPQETNTSGNNGVPLDQIEKKMQRLISFKRPSKWTDDAYLLYGYAQLLAGQYDSSEVTFSYVIQNYQPEDLKFIHYFKEDDSRRRLYMEARLERQQEKKDREEERLKRIKQRERRKKKVDNLKKKEIAAAKKLKLLEAEKKKDQRKFAAKNRKEAQKLRQEEQRAREKARKKGEREEMAALREQYAQKRQDLYEERTKGPEEDEKRKSKKERYSEREERLRQMRLALLEENKEKDEESRKLDSFELAEETLGMDIIEGIEDSVSLAEKQQAIEDRKKAEAAAALLEQIKEQQQLDSLTRADSIAALQALQDSLLAASLIARQDTNSLSNLGADGDIYFFEDQYHDGHQRDIYKSEENLFQKIDPHYPAYFDALSYLALTKNRKKEYAQAESYLRELFDYELPKETREASYLVIADNYLSRKNYTAALKALDYAIEAGSIERKTKGRLSFIKGQVLETLGKKDLAAIAYAEVGKFHPGLIMELQAEIKSATLTAESGSTDEGIRKLNQLKNNKRFKTRYSDVITLALGKTLAQAGNLDEALENLRTSIATNQERPFERYQALALLSDITFGRKDYVKSYEYAAEIASITKTEDMEDHDKYVDRSNRLRDIAENLVVIQELDSLMDIAKLPEKEKMKLAKKLLREQRKQEKYEKGVELGLIPTNTPRNNVFTRDSKKSGFFAYNANLVKEGVKSFNKTWNRRPNADFWRFESLIQSLDTQDEVATEESATEDGEKDLSKSVMEEVLIGVPMNEAEFDEALKSKYDAALIVGINFREQELSLDRSDDYLTKVVNFDGVDENSKKLALSYLYQNALDRGMTSAANKYKDLLDQLDPDYEAYVLDDADDAVIGNQVSDKYADDEYTVNYDRIYLLYQDGEYEKVYEETGEYIKAMSTDHPFLPKYRLLESYTIGRLSGKENYMAALKDLNRRHRNTPEGDKALEIFLALESSQSTKLNREPVVKPTELNKDYNGFDPDVVYDRHYVLVVIDQGTKAIGQRNKIQAFNDEEKFKNLNTTLLSLSSSVENPKTKEFKRHAILIKSFKNMDEAMEYCQKAMLNPSNYLTEPDVFSVYAISQKNFRTLTNGINIQDYASFFEEIYLR